MHAQGRCADRVRTRQPRTTDSQPTQPVAPHLLARDFTASAPNRKWVADIPGVATRSGWLSLAALLDVSSRRASGWAMDTYRAEHLVATALDMALTARHPAAGLVHHSDRGSQYTSTGCQGCWESLGIVLSMSGKGEPYDNALLESFFSTLKAECVDRCDFQTPQQARACIFEYLEVFYNRQRLHSSLGYCSPLAFELIPTVT